MKISTLFLRLAWAILFIISNHLSYSQAPYSFNYQGLARDDAGAPLAEQTINLKISLLRDAPDGIVQFQEEQSTTTTDRGLFAIRIGEGNALIGSLSSIDWSTGSYFIRVEMDPDGGQNFINLGSTQLYSVPYALYALSSGGSDGGGSQNLTLDGSVLSIEGGNSVDLGSLEDADADPENELQTLSINQNTLSISGGNSIDLPTSSGSNGGNGGLSLWTEDNGSVVYENGPGMIIRNNGNVQYNFVNTDEGASWSTHDESGQFATFSFPFTSGAGFYGTVGPNGSTNVRMSISASSPDRGFIGVADEEGRSKIGAFIGSSGTGSLYTEGPNGNLNTYLTFLSGNPDNGYIGVYDADDNSQAGIYVDANGQGRIFADFVDNFVDNPEKSGEKIVYTMIQGPESATYLRGTSKMENGIASIEFPSHFSNQILSENITVLITPLSADSKGIAVIKKGTSGFAVKELLQGQGNYEFDWEVKGVRKISNYKSLELPDVAVQNEDDRRAPVSAEEEAKGKMNLKNN